MTFLLLSPSMCKKHPTYEKDFTVDFAMVIMVVQLFLVMGFGVWKSYAGLFCSNLDIVHCTALHWTADGTQLHSIQQMR